jgi:hypothetical protein
MFSCKWVWLEKAALKLRKHVQKLCKHVQKKQNMKFTDKTAMSFKVQKALGSVEFIRI